MRDEVIEKVSVLNEFSKIVIGALLVILPGKLFATGDEPIPINHSAERELLSVAGNGFYIKRTDHFLVAYNTDSENLYDFISRLEATYNSTQRFLKVLDIPFDHPQNRLEIIFFSHRNEFLRYADGLGMSAAGAAGFYHSRTNRAAFFDTASMPQLVAVDKEIQKIRRSLRNLPKRRNKKQREELDQQMRKLRNRRNNIIESVNQLVVQHEVTHQIFYNCGLHTRNGDNPKWVVEGLACLFEPPPSADGAGLGVINQYRLLNFHEALTGIEGKAGGRIDHFENAVRAGRLVSLQQLIGDKQIFDTRRANVDGVYAEAWSLMHYLQRFRRDDLSVYLTVLAKRPTGRGYTREQELMQFEHVFGPITEDFQRRWLKYVLSLRVKIPKI